MRICESYEPSSSFVTKGDEAAWRPRAKESLKLSFFSTEVEKMTIKLEENVRGFLQSQIQTSISCAEIEEALLKMPGVVASGKNPVPDGADNKHKIEERSYKTFFFSSVLDKETLESKVPEILNMERYFTLLENPEGGYAHGYNNSTERVCAVSIPQNVRIRLYVRCIDWTPRGGVLIKKELPRRVFWLWDTDGSKKQETEILLAQLEAILFGEPKWIPCPRLYRLDFDRFPGSKDMGIIFFSDREERIKEHILRAEAFLSNAQEVVDAAKKRVEYFKGELVRPVPEEESVGQFKKFKPYLLV